MSGNDTSAADPYGTDYGNFSLSFKPTNRLFVKPNWDKIKKNSTY